MFNQNEVKRLKELYVPGTKVRLIQMKDVQAPPIGSIGKVTHVDDAGQIHVRWDNGSGLALVPSEDIFEIVGN